MGGKSYKTIVPTTDLYHTTNLDFGPITDLVFTNKCGNMSYVFLKGRPYKDFTKLLDHKYEDGTSIDIVPISDCSFEDGIFKGTLEYAMPDKDGDVKEDFRLTFDDDFLKITDEMVEFQSKNGETRVEYEKDSNHYALD